MPLFAISDGWDVAGFVLTMVGFVLTLLSLWYAIIQVRKTMSAAEAAQRAAEEAVRESRRSFQRYEVAVVLRFVNEARLFVEAKDWVRAAMRVADLADRAGQLANLSSEWQNVATELRRWADKFSRLTDGSSLTPPAKTKWKNFVQRLQGLLDVFHGPFTRL